jgi:hypothetical protein
MNKALFFGTDTDLWFDVIDDLNVLYNISPQFFIGDKESGIRLKRKYNIDVMTRNELFNMRGNYLDKKHDRVMNFELLEKIAYAESILNEMLSRYTTGKLDYNSMRQYYLDSVELIFDIIQRNEVDLIVCGSPPHRYHDYLFYVVSKALNIKFITYEFTLVNNGAYMMSSLEDRSSVFLSKHTKEYNPSDIALKYYDEIIAEKVKINHNYISKEGPNSIVNKNVASFYIPNYISILFIFKLLIFWRFLKKDESKILSYGGEFISKVSNPTILSVVVNKIKNVNKIKKCISFYKNNSVYINKCDSYILFAANFQPERSTCPDAGYFSDLKLAIDILYKGMPEGMYLYYREHPTTFKILDAIGSPRTLKFYSDLKIKYPKLKFISTDENMIDLIESSAVVSTATGSVGWEAILNNKPVFIFGDVWYRSAPNVFYIENNEQYDAALSSVKYKYNDNDNDNDNVLNFIDNVVTRTANFDKLQYSNIAFRGGGVSSDQVYKQGDPIAHEMAKMIYGVFMKKKAG